MGREPPVIAIKGNGSKQSPIRSTQRILMIMSIRVRSYMCAEECSGLNICDNYTIIS